MEIRFLHLKAFTRGMRVIWAFKETPAGVLVEIQHTLHFRVASLAPLAEPIIGGFFVHHVANQTLRVMKAKIEGAIAEAAAQPRPA
jgi:Na+/glutamate symporter